MPQRDAEEWPRPGSTPSPDAAIVGAIDSFTVSTNPAGDATAHTYSSYPLPAEMTATGEIVDGKPHIHAVIAVQGDRTIGGHLHQAHIRTSFARAYVIPSDHHVVVPPTSRSCSNNFPMKVPLRAEGSSTTPESHLQFADALHTRSVKPNERESE
jgi:hypothetical protein